MKTQEIFNLTTPYNNPYQGTSTRLLFVCTAGLLRSPTLAHVALEYGYNTRSCGSNLELALIPISVNLITWSNKVYFLALENYRETLYNFRLCGKDFIKNLEDKSHVLNIPDIFNYMQPELVSLAKEIITNEINPLK